MAEIGWLAAGGCAGAIARYGVSVWMAALWPARLPIGTLLVNVIGSFLLGLVAGGGLDERMAFFLGTGFLGAFTTFSTFKMESVHLLRRGEAAIGWLYMALSYVLGIGAAWLGYGLGSA